MDKLILIGIDAFDPTIVTQLIDKLPHFKKLQRLKLETTIPPETPVAWSAAATGCNPGKYGIFDFISRDPQTYLPHLNLAREKHGVIKTEYASAMKGIPFWKILSDHNIPTTVIRWPVTFPAEKINGRMLSGLGVVDIKGLLNSYSFYTSEVCQQENTKENNDKIIPITVENGRVDTYISGPLTRKKSDLTDIRIPLKIAIKDTEAVFVIQKKEFRLKPQQWSPIMRVGFRVNMFVEVSGIFNIYLESLEPLRMYLSSIQIDPAHQAINITFPKEYGKELAENIGLFYTLGMPEDTKAVTESHLSTEAFVQQINQIENERKKMFFYELERFKEGVLAFVFDAGDRLQHIFWNQKVLEGNTSAALPKEIEEYYTNKDRLLGEVLSKIDEDTKLMIMSDHGFSSFERQVNINSWLVENGYMNVNSEKRNSSLFDFVDWKETVAYSVGFTSIFLNLVGRESKGIVTSSQQDKLINEIIKKLRTLKDGSSNVFTKIYKGSEIYHGTYASDAPDMIVGFSPGYRMSWKNAMGTLDPTVISKNTSKWKGDHLIDHSHVPGILCTNFLLRPKQPPIMDIASTVLKLFKIKIPDSMDGESLV